MPLAGDRPGQTDPARGGNCSYRGSVMKVGKYLFRDAVYSATGEWSLACDAAY